ncbi:MAG TPA: COX15/CtaA family protein [Cyclobacteriaceae bacterium]|nr:COX15/CtaA family protein [Cyclobacteriaceae bacterium]
MSQPATKGFRKLCFATLVAVYFLIMVGGVVRSTGSGMGCPDWPTCFGKIVPPTSAEQLPSDYKEFYSAYRHAKNVKFAKYLSLIGLDETADQLLDDESIREEADFNATKTWVEYINRLVGVAVGLLIIALVWKALPLRTTHRRVFLFSVLTLVTVIIQGWFGSIVVSTNLTTWTITIHMFLALVIVAFLIYMLHLVESTSVKASAGTKWLLIICMLLLLVQTFLGTEVRSLIDTLAGTVIPRSRWVEALGLEFVVHRSFSWSVLIVHVILLIRIRKTTGDKIFPLTLIILILGAILTGTGMAYFGVPAFLQPLHLVLATLIFGVQLKLYFRMNTGSDLMFNKA